ncbi:RluA family pseudouridine synthase [Candidatus Nomurabacteria bacterium]|nr:RluA family pseudouridine synthase [Candidatus Nomurabacteria bacterium]
MKIKVLYEDKDILAIDKPSGVLAHPDKIAEGRTILDWARKKYPKAELAHRLDRETSGVMLIAKNEKAHGALKKQFQERVVKKIYNAIVSGSFRNDRGMINKPIGRSPRDFRRYLAGRGARGEMREAITEYRVLKHLRIKTDQKQIDPDISVNQKGISIIGSFTFLEVKPKTGRTHQIRVHMKYINHPVACDSLYNPAGMCPPGFKRLALHAKSIEFKNLKGETIKVESSLPKEFKELTR